jgi:phage regulator Rha-like protein
MPQTLLDKFGAYQKELERRAAEIAKLRAENERLRAILEDAVETLEAMDLHADNPLYERMQSAIEQLPGMHRDPDDGLPDPNGQSARDEK